MHFGILENGKLNKVCSNPNVNYPSLLFLSALWVTHFTVDKNLRQVVIFENWKCSEITGKRCVLYTHQDAEDYTLVGKVGWSEGY